MRISRSVLCGVSALLACAALLLCAGGVAEEQNDFAWKKAQRGGAAITGYTGNSVEIVIPERIGAMAVTEIADAAFYHRTDIVSVAVPDTVEWIGEGAFENCRSLVSIELPEKLKTIDEHAFLNCQKLERLLLPAGLKSIGEGAFELCMNLEIELSDKNTAFSNRDGFLIDKTSKILLAYTGGEADVQVPDGVKRIGFGAFAANQTLRRVSLPEGLLGVGVGAFQGCIRLEEIALPQSLNVVEAKAFRLCLSLDHIRIPDNTSRIGSDVFNLCPSLQVQISDRHEYYSVEGNRLIEKPYERVVIYTDRQGSRKDTMSCRDYTLISAWGETGGTLVLPDHVTSVYMSLYDLEGLESVVVHEGVKLLYPGVFSYCPSLKNITVEGKETVFFDFMLTDDDHYVLTVYKDSLARANLEQYGLPHRLVGSDNLVVYVHENAQMRRQLEEEGIPFALISGDDTETF